MKIVVVGGGSVGLLAAARLQLGGQQVHLVTRTAGQAARVQQQGLTMRALDGQVRQVAVDVSPAAAGLPLADIYLLTVKAPDVSALLPVLSAIPESARVIAMQNGMSHVEVLTTHLSPGQLFFAVNTEGARRHSPVEVEHTGSGTIRVGPWEKQETPDRLIDAFAAAARKSGMDVQWVDTAAPLLWRKLLVNALINPLTALFEVENGGLLRSPETLPVMRALFEEAAAVADACGRKIGEADWQEIVTICRNTWRNHSSMLQDIQHGRPTEIDAILGYLTGKADAHGIAVPMLRTALLAVRVKEAVKRSGKSEAQESAQAMG